MSGQSLDAIAEALVRAVETVEGAGGKCHRGRFNLNAPPAIPWASLTAVAPTSSVGPVMGQYSWRLVWQVQVWCRSERSDLDTRVLASEAMLDRVVSALQDERDGASSPLRSLPNWRVSGGVLDALLDPLPPNAGFVVVTVEHELRRKRGLSGVTP